MAFSVGGGILASHASLAAPRELVCNPRLRGDPMSDTKQSTPEHRIEVRARTRYLPEQSDVDQGRYVFAYTITITNRGGVTAQLVSRHWIITDAEDKVQEVRGMGVIGEQPVLRPGESFEYTSGTAIATPVGTMRGTYQMVGEDGSRFDATIPPFTLAIPRVLH
jgi:ApaG protein